MVEEDFSGELSGLTHSFHSFGDSTLKHLFNGKPKATVFAQRSRLRLELNKMREISSLALRACIFTAQLESLNN